MADYSLVLLGRLAGKDIPVARALSDAFGQPVTWGEQMVTQSPITLLTGLKTGQARQIKEALAGIEKVGCKFDLREGIDASFPRITWQNECKLFDRPVPAYLTDGDKRQPSVQTFSFVIPPSTVPLRIDIRISPDASATAAPLGIDGARPIAVPPPGKLRPASNADSFLGVPPPLTPAQQRLKESQEIESADVAIIELDEIAEPVAPPSAAPAPALLPDVPLIPSLAKLGPAITPPANVRPAMRLEDFEAGFRDMPPPSSAPLSTPRVEQLEPLNGGFVAARAAPQDTRLFDVSITSCASPQAIQLLAKTLGLDIPTAQKRAKRPVITVARNVSEQDANAMAAEFERAGARAAIKVAR